MATSSQKRPGSGPPRFTPPAAPPPLVPKDEAPKVEAAKSAVEADRQPGGAPPRTTSVMNETRIAPDVHLKTYTRDLPKPQYPGSTLKLALSRLKLWGTSKFLTLALTLVVSIKARLRMSHNNGLVVSGRLRIVDEPDFPLHPLFVPGKVFDCRIRHAAASFMDDAMRCVRSASLKFADDDFDSPLDLECNTGPIALFWSAASFLRFAGEKKERYGIQYVDYYRHLPGGSAGAYAGLRRNPESFADQHYYSQTPLYYIASDGVTRYAKYRIRPFDDIPETGLLDIGELEIGPGDQRTLPGEQRSRNYMKEEYLERLQHGSVKYRLQIQIHDATEDDDPEIFNCCREWDAEIHPFMDLAIIEIDHAHDWETSCLTSYSLGNASDGLGILPSWSVYDYNSLNYLRGHSELARRARLWMYRKFGVPADIPDDDIRNQ